MTDAEKEAFVDAYFDHEGIRLDPNAIEYNRGLRSTMKIILTSLWGKFGQRPNMTQSTMCMTPQEFYAIVLNEQVDVTGMHQCPTNPKVMELLYCEKESSAEEPLNTNVYIACFTTCNGRLRLYDLLDQLGTRVLYYDTDSVIYRHSLRPEDQLDMPRVGPYLGDLTNELGSDNTRWITEFVSTGPKSYSFCDNFGRVKCKFKGISKTLYNLKQVNLKSMVRCIQPLVAPDDLKSDEPPHKKRRVEIEAQNLRFQLDQFGRIKADYEPKLFRTVYDKRWIDSATYVTYPWGY